MKIILDDLTFLIPIRLDSIIRLENLLTTVNFIQKNFKTNIFVLETASFNNGILEKLLKREIKYTFIEDKDPIFHRTKYRNMMTKEVNTPFLAVWDADVIVDKKQILDSLSQLRDGRADISYPFDGSFYDTTDIIRSLYLRRNKIGVLHQNIGRMSLIYGNKHKGGAFIANLHKYKLTGLENENFYGWGPEDYERYERWVNMGLKIHQSLGPMYHMTHPRDINGQFSSSHQMSQARAELTKTKKSSFCELVNEKTSHKIKIHDVRSSD